MIPKYNSLLPSYLRGGVNIGKHGRILDAQNKKIEEKTELLQQMYNPVRPILIERVQTIPRTCDVNIHVNTRSPIRTISVDGVVEEEYSEDDVITSAIVTKEYTDDIPPVMPDVVVEVECYDGTLYKKGYPENDVPKKNMKDHDEFLDIVGNLLGIPRRTYLDVNYGQGDDAFKDNYPAFFTKSMRQSTGSCTEDDYYYSQRLQKFIGGLNRNDFVVHMADTLYEWNTSSIDHVEGRTTFLYDALSELTGGASVYDLLVTGSPRYLNMDYSNMNSILANYYPITRLLFALDSILLLWGVIGGYDDTTHTLVFDGATEYIDIDDENQDVSNAVFDVAYYNVRKEEVASETVTCDEFVATCTRQIQHTDIFAKIKPHLMYEIKNGEQYEEIITNILTNYQTYSFDDYVKLIDENANSYPLPDFNLDNWYCTYDSTDGESNSMLMGYFYLGKYCNNFTPSLPDSDWLVSVEFYTNQHPEKYGDVILVGYLNNVDGSTFLKITGVEGGTYLSTDWNVQAIEYTDGTVTRSTNLGNININHGTLMMERKGNRLRFTYLTPDGVKVLYTRTYSSLSVNGCLYAYNFASWKTRLSKHHRYKIGESYSDMADLPIYKQNDWVFASRGTGSTDPTISNDGILTIGKNSTHTYTPVLDTNKAYKLYIDTPNPNGAVGIGITNNGGNPVRQLLNTGTGGITGQNKVTLQHDGLSWYISFNEDIQIQLDNRNNPQIYLLSNQYSTASQHRILAITESNGGGAITDKYTIKSQEEAEIETLNPNNWTNGPTQQEDGTLKFKNKTYQYRTQLQTDGRYILEIDSTNHTSTFTARIPEGHIAMTTGTNTILIFYENQNGTQVEINRKTLPSFTTSTMGINTITVERKDNKVTFKYTTEDGTLVEETRTYNNLSDFPVSLWTSSTQEVTLRAITLLEKIIEEVEE